MVESDRLLYHRFKQPGLRINKEKSLHECILQGETKAISSSQRIILPKSFIRGPRYMFKDYSKLRILDDIDTFICAKILDKVRNPNLYAAVESTWSMDHVANTTIIVCACEEENFEVDNSFIVPYNPSLLLKYACHINVEYTCQTSAIKYLFKYVHKGNDKVTAAFYQSGTSQVDEIHNYVDCRYISACETAWRLFSYPIQIKESTIIRLSFHLPDDKNVIYKRFY
ncbi:uncharacterized protein LOC107633563 [Arachis ipaensis]|uniref:uncharacterized protein LOC107633563 n=1 Tax=Arachis ipaensis TaxID=130454 RepID=UPI0007AF9063|nr:uncharacterized protein LOC107633563 [Arachis ipaensis]